MMRKVFSFRETEPLWRRSLHKGFRYFVSQDTDCIHLSPSVKCIWNAITNWPRDFVQWTTCLYAKEPWKKSQSPKRSIEKYLNLLRPGCISTQKYDIAICWFCLPFNLKTNATKRKGTCSWTVDFLLCRNWHSWHVQKQLLSKGIVQKKLSLGPTLNFYEFFSWTAYANSKLFSPKKSIRHNNTWSCNWSHIFVFLRNDWIH